MWESLVSELTDNIPVCIYIHILFYQITYSLQVICDSFCFPLKICPGHGSQTGVILEQILTGHEAVSLYLIGRLAFPVTSGLGLSLSYF